MTRSKSCGSFAVISILGINDRNTAELFRNKEIVVPRKDGQKLSKDSYYIVDIIGSSLTTEDGEILGKITDVTKAKTDIFTVKTVDGRILRFPFLKDLLVLVDVEKSIMTVKRQRLFEVSVYED